MLEQNYERAYSLKKKERNKRTFSIDIGDDHEENKRRKRTFTEEEEEISIVYIQLS